MQTDKAGQDTEILELYRKLERKRSKIRLLKQQLQSHKLDEENLVQDIKRVLQETLQPFLQFYTQKQEIPLHRPPEPDPPQAPPSLPMKRARVEVKKEAENFQPPPPPAERPFENQRALLPIPEVQKGPQLSTQLLQQYFSQQPQNTKSFVMEPYLPSSDPASEWYLPNLQNAQKALKGYVVGKKESSQIEEAFEVIRKLLKSGYPITDINIELLVDSLKGISMNQIVKEVIENLLTFLDLLTPNDAYGILLQCGISVMETGSNSQFLKYMLEYLISASYQQKKFTGQSYKFTVQGIQFQDDSMQNVLLHTYVQLSRRYNQYGAVRDLYFIVYIRRDYDLLEKILQIASDFLDLGGFLSFKVLKLLVNNGYRNNLNNEDYLQANFPVKELFKILSLHISQCVEQNFPDYCKTSKFVIKICVTFTQNIDQVKLLYKQYLWSCFVSALKSSFARILVIKCMGEIIKIYKNSQDQFVQKLKEILEEILTDETLQSNYYSAFSFKEQKAAAQGLIKIQANSPTLLAWRSKY